MAIESKIASAIQVQRFELIRDRIAEILVVEFQSQTGLQTDPRVKDIIGRTTFFTERFRPLNESEMSSVVLFTFNAQYDNKHQTSVRGKYQYVLDVFSREPDTQIEDGDIEAALNAQTIVGMIRAILEDPNWIRLGFDPNPTTEQNDGVFIESTLFSSIKRTEEEDTRDSGNILMYRMIFEVTANEQVSMPSGLPLVSSITNVLIAQTENGYQYINTSD